MTIEITPDGYLPRSKDVPVVGRVYNLEDSTTGSFAQGKAWHALAQEYWKSGAHSYPAKTFAEFRNYLKRDLGSGFEAYIWIDPKNPTKINDAKSLDQIPPGIPRDLKRGRLKSWADYTLKERRNAIDALIKEMDQAGVDTPKYREIIAGLERGSDDDQARRPPRS